MHDQLRVGGIILCGGKSSRMGVPKAALPFGPELMLQRIARLLSAVAAPIVVVAAGGQSLPDLSPAVIVKHDEQQERGPLEGLRVGLTALASQVDAAYATSCDVPLLVPAFVSRMIAALGEHDTAVPVDGEFYQPLAAVYRTRTVTTIEQLLRQDKLRASDLFAVLRTNRVPLRELRGIDPELLTLMNVNTPSDYRRVLQLAGFPIDSTMHRQLGL